MRLSFYSTLVMAFLGASETIGMSLRSDPEFSAAQINLEADSGIEFSPRKMAGGAMGAGMGMMGGAMNAMGGSGSRKGQQQQQQQ